MFPQKTLLTNPLFYFQKSESETATFVGQSQQNFNVGRGSNQQRGKLEAMLLTEAEAGNALKNMPVRLTLMT